MEIPIRITEITVSEQNRDTQCIAFQTMRTTEWHNNNGTEHNEYFIIIVSLPSTATGINNTRRYHIKNNIISRICIVITIPMHNFHLTMVIHQWTDITHQPEGCIAATVAGQPGRRQAARIARGRAGQTIAIPAAQKLPTAMLASRRRIASRNRQREIAAVSRSQPRHAFIDISWERGFI